MSDSEGPRMSDAGHDHAAMKVGPGHKAAMGVQEGHEAGLGMPCCRQAPLELDELGRQAGVGAC